MRWSLRVVAAVVSGVLSLAAHAGEILNLGANAPALDVSAWVKGEKIERFEPGKTYVVEFWATWCGPCKVSIPHITELAHKYKAKGVQFVGVDVWEQETARVKPFVDEMGAKMDYSVALDNVPAKGGPNDGAMAKGWMKAAEENGIPTAFVIHDGKIAWIGHPMDLDKPLEKIVDGKWNIGEMAKTRLAEKAKEQRASVVREKVFPLYQSRDYKATVKAIRELAHDDSELKAEFEWVEFAALCNGADVEAGLKMGTKLLETHHDNPGALNNYFWNVIDPDLEHTPDPRIAKLALEAASRAVELTKGKDPAQLDTLAEAQFLTGNSAAAVKTEEKALEIVKEASKGQPHPYIKIFGERIERFKKGASLKNGKK